VTARHDPTGKGLVQRANGYLETSFLPGRRFASPQDFNAQLEQWLIRANNRMHRALQAHPPTGSTRTGPRWSRYRRSALWSAGG